MNLTDHFTFEEMVFSSTALRLGIDNTPPPVIAFRLKECAIGLEQVRSLLGHPMRIDSGYRCPALNKAVGGAPNSSHMDGYAADFVCHGFGKPIDIVHAIQASSIGFDKLIQEGNWVHISFDPRMRSQVYTAHFSQAGTTYTVGA